MNYLNKNKKELIAICKEKKIKKYSNLKKNEIITLIKQSFIQPDDDIILQQSFIQPDDIIIQQIVNMDMEKQLLKNILNSSVVDYKKEIMLRNSIKEAHIYCKLKNLSGQLSGSLIEKFIKNKYKMVKNNSSLCIGDLYHKEIGKNFEIKISNGGKTHNKFNFVQLRINHNCDYLFTAYYLDNSNINTLGELFIFRITKIDIKQLILKYGTYAHGTLSKLGSITNEDLDNLDNTKEYCIRPEYNSKCWNYLLQFRINYIC